MKKNLIYKFRVNSRGAEFYSAKVMDLEDLRSYSSVTRNEKTIRGAISALNKDGERRYANCMVSQIWYVDCGKIEVPDGAKTDLTRDSKDDLVKAVGAEFGDSVMQQLDSAITSAI